MLAQCYCSQTIQMLASVVLSVQSHQISTAGACTQMRVDSHLQRGHEGLHLLRKLICNSPVYICSARGSLVLTSCARSTPGRVGSIRRWWARGASRATPPGSRYLLHGWSQARPRGSAHHFEEAAQGPMLRTAVSVTMSRTLL
jgi:hypothetical protein